MYSFNFLGKDSFGDFGIMLEKRPVIPKPQRNIEYIEVPGRSGSLKIDDQTYKDIIIAVQCWFKDDDVASKADEVKAWLDSGEGRLIFGNQMDKYYIAHVSDQFDITQELKILGQFQINFRCQPFKYDVNNDAITLLTPRVIINPGTVACEPVVVINGSGAITLTINNSEIKLTGINEHITIDSVLKDAYKGTALQNSLMVGDFPVLVPGTNSIDWTGSVSSMQITPNWRWL